MNCTRLKNLNFNTKITFILVSNQDMIYMYFKFIVAIFDFGGHFDHKAAILNFLALNVFFVYFLKL